MRWLVALALASCVTDHPRYPDCEMVAKPHQYDAELLWQGRVVEAGLATAEQMHRWYPLCYWCSHPCDDDLWPQDHRVGVIGHICAAGTTTSDGVIYLADWGGALHETALAHELTHATMLWVIGETWEPPQPLDDWWSLSIAFDQELQRRGW